MTAIFDCAKEAQGSGVGVAMLAEAVAMGVQTMPRPVVSVEEIRNVGHRVDVLERLGEI